MKRREFLIRAGQAVIAAPVILTAISCGDDEGGPTNPNTPGFSSTSSTANSHSHSITVRCADLSAGPVDYSSSAASGHIHTVTLTAPELSRILGGETIDKQSSTDDGHFHTWRIQKPANACA